MLEVLLRGKLSNILGFLLIALGLLPTASCLLVLYFCIKPNTLPEIAKLKVFACTALIVVITPLCVLLFYIIFRQISKFIDEFCQGIDQISQGNFGIFLQPRYFAEFDKLVESFNCMSWYLSLARRKLTDKISLLQKESEEIRTAYQNVTKNNLQLKELILQDPLTGIFNRRYLMQQLHWRVKISMRYKQPLAVLFLDIDYFKEINDTYGHQVGDQVLRELVRILLLAIRGTDILTRYGGEEFIILAPQTDLPSATRLAERIRERIASNAFHTQKGVIHFTVSIGVATFDGKKEYRPEEIVEKLLAFADRRCYEAKAKGRNRVDIISIEEPRK